MFLINLILFEVWGLSLTVSPGTPKVKARLLEYGVTEEEVSHVPYFPKVYGIRPDVGRGRGLFVRPWRDPSGIMVGLHGRVIPNGVHYMVSSEIAVKRSAPTNRDWIIEHGLPNSVHYDLLDPTEDSYDSRMALFTKLLYKRKFIIESKNSNHDTTYHVLVGRFHTSDVSLVLFGPVTSQNRHVILSCLEILPLEWICCYFFRRTYAKIQKDLLPTLRVFEQKPHREEDVIGLEISIPRST